MIGKRSLSSTECLSAKIEQDSQGWKREALTVCKEKRARRGGGERSPLHLGHAEFKAILISIVNIFKQRNSEPLFKVIFLLSVYIFYIYRHRL